MAVTGLVLGLAALSGAITGTLVFLALDLVAPGASSASDTARMAGIAAGFGAVLGGTIGTPIAMLMLRRVPLWRAIVETAAAAGAGSAIGNYLLPFRFGLVAWAVVFALLAAWRLQRAYAKTDR